MKTAMQELIEIHGSRIYPTDLHVWITQNKERLLEKEKEQIRDAYHKGGYLLTKKPYGEFVKEVEEYYNQTYNQNK